MDTINIGILAHVDAGKTTVTEALLYAAGALNRPGRVDHGDTVADALSIERARGITVRASTVSFRHLNVKVNLLDTPGHVDFIAEVERSLSVLDGAVLVVSAREGVQSQTAVLFRALQRLRIPALIFVNKLDRLGADPAAVVRQMRERLSPSLLARQTADVEGDAPRIAPLALGGEALDALFPIDDEVARRFVDGPPLNEGELRAAYLRAVGAGRLYPVYFGVALDGLGIPELMDAIVGELPGAPAGQALSALAYKLEFHPRFGRLCYLRVYGGCIRMRKEVALEGGEARRVTTLLSPEGGALRPVDRVCAGDIAALPPFGDMRVGSALGEPPPVRVAALAEPMLLARASWPADVPRDRALEALSRLAMEDPLLALRANPETGELELKVFGQVQMEILCALAAERFGLALRLSRPRTVFRERPARPAEGGVRMGETAFQAGLGIAIEPLPEGEGLHYRTEVDYGYLYAPFQNAVRDGLMTAAERGPCGWALTDARIALKWAQYSSVTSTPSDFRDLAPVALIRALAQSGTELLQPMLRYQLDVPLSTAGRASYDLILMNATMDEVLAEGDRIRYAGVVPLDACKEYPAAVAAYAKGEGVFSVRPHGYARYEGDREAASNPGYRMPSESAYLLGKGGRIK
ncbi:MAG: TetM/TetW/TetO/TetS family tetracycline resistance ribosomal protection protein [Clostridiales bacterium]|nr:TetM/TetW/TetO/TetS family tetracycline resistance ribosomal protection protein [Clostridiales bacterium]